MWTLWIPVFYRIEENQSNVRLSCCKNGAYRLPIYSNCSEALKNLYLANSANAFQFRREIRPINSVFAMASFKVSRRVDCRKQQGHWSFSTCGQIYYMDGQYTERRITKKSIITPLLFFWQCGSTGKKKRRF